MLERVPVTPFHGGIGLACKGPLGARFSFTVFVATQIVIDLESAYFLLTEQHPVHRFLHTFLGASLACLFVALVLRSPCEAVLRALPADFLPQWLDRDGNRKISTATALLSAFAGMLAHVVPDAVMHADVRPLAPFSDVNPFLNAISLVSLHLGLVGLGLFGLVWLSVAAWLSDRRR
jgi:hypothetical protein